MSNLLRLSRLTISSTKCLHYSIPNSNNIFKNWREKRALKKSIKKAEKEKKNEYWKKINSLEASKRDDILDEESHMMREKATRANNKYLFPFFFCYIYLMSMWEFGFDRRKKDGSQPVFGFFDPRRNYYCWRNILECLESYYDNDEILLSEKSELYGENKNVWPEYTIIIEPLKIFIQPEYDLQTGWRFKKAKGFDTFLKIVGVDLVNQTHNNMELVAWTNKSVIEVDNYLSIFGEKKNFILMKENNTFKLGLLEMDLLNGILPKSMEYKNIELLRRDVKKIIFIENPENIENTSLHKKHPDNVLVIPEVNKNNNESVMHLLAFLLLVSRELQLPDVRPVIRHYNKFGENWLQEFKNDRSFIFEEAQRQGVDISRFTQNI